MRKSILEAVRSGHWDYEPPVVPQEEYGCTESMPGTKGKLEIMAERIQGGLPLWHPEDKAEVDEEEYRRTEAKLMQATHCNEMM